MSAGQEQSASMFQGVLEAPSVRPVLTPRLIPTAPISEPIQSEPAEVQPPSRASEFLASISNAAAEINHNQQQPPFRRSVSKSRLAEIRQAMKSRAFNGRVR